MNINKISNKKRFYISLVVGVLAAFSLSFTVREIKNASDKLASINKAKNSLEKDIDTKINNEISSNYALNENLEKKNTNSQNESKGSKNENVNNQTDQDKKTLENDTLQEEKTKETIATNNRDKNIAKLTFNEEVGLMWPLKGDIVKNYSVDKLVYFPTLGVFKANPAIFISAKEGDEVKSAHKGIVTSVGQDKELGKYVEIAIGNDYTLLYGQLTDIQVEEENKVEEGDTLAYVASPSPYYTKEGSHLYLKVMQDGKTVDPMLLLR